MFQEGPFSQHPADYQVVCIDRLPASKDVKRQVMDSVIPLSTHSGSLKQLRYPTSKFDQSEFFNMGGFVLRRHFVTSEESEVYLCAMGQTDVSYYMDIQDRWLSQQNQVMPDPTIIKALEKLLFEIEVETNRSMIVLH